MWGATHGTIGVLGAGSLALALHRPDLALPMALAGGLGGLVPDIDTPHSTIAGLPLLRYATRPLAGLIERTLGHRGPTHHLVAALLAAFLCGLLAPRAVAVGLCCGYVLHLLGDMLTVSGVRCLWPLPWRHLTPAPLRLNMKRGSERVFEWVLRPALVLAVAAFWTRHDPALVLALAHHAQASVLHAYALLDQMAGHTSGPGSAHG